MKYIRQFTIILGISFVGEALNHFLPLPVPASIYGLLLMLLLLGCGVLKISHIRETSSFLLDVMPVMFVPPAVGIIKCWDIINPILLPCIIITVLVTAIVMAVTGLVTQRLVSHSGEEEHNAQ